ncbi:hypothetical protein HRbin33_02384 [bacterium HR33]|nr:hypothetical protein HRbin33_02384 [bacterium HR33]
MRPSLSRLAWAWGLACLLSPASQLDAQTDGTVAEGGAAFLLVPVGARAVALGQAAVADFGSGELAFWNPAGLALLPRSELGIHHARTFASNNTALAGYVSMRRVGTFGAAAYLVDFGSQEVRPGPGPPTGRTTVRNIELLASYATTIVPSLAVGINYKLIQFRNDCSGDCGLFPTEVGTTHGLDVGVQYLVGVGNGLRLGLAIQHAGFALQIENRPQADPLPTRVQLGAQYQVELPTPEDTEPAYARILFDLQDAWGSYSNPEARVGLELGLGELIRMRGGYAFLHSESRGPSIGAGVTFGRVTVDFARIFFESGRFDEPVYLSLRAAL